MAKKRKISSSKVVSVHTNSSLLAEALTVDNEYVEQIRRKLDDKPSSSNTQALVVHEEPAEVMQQSPASDVQSTNKREKVPLVKLKEASRFPEKVEWHDSRAPDPYFLVHIKCLPGVVPVPSEWKGKSERNYRRTTYKLPKNIYDTGISKLRDVYQESEASLKQQTRERVQPKLGTLDLDYRKMHAAFFKFQERPRLGTFGQVHHEGVELEADFDQFRAGVISERLRAALGLKPDQDVPWAHKAEKLGPSPAYSGLQPDKSNGTQSIRHWGELEKHDDSDDESNDASDSE